MQQYTKHDAAAPGKPLASACGYLSEKILDIRWHLVLVCLDETELPPPQSFRFLLTENMEDLGLKSYP